MQNALGGVFYYLMKNTGYDLTSGTRRTFDVRDGHKEADVNSQITIRSSSEADRAEIARLAALDSREVPADDLVLGFVDDELRAAVAVRSGETVADPLHRTAELVELLQHTQAA